MFCNTGHKREEKLKVKPKVKFILTFQPNLLLLGLH